MEESFTFMNMLNAGCIGAMLILLVPELIMKDYKAAFISLLALGLNLTAILL